MNQREIKITYSKNNPLVNKVYGYEERAWMVKDATVGSGFVEFKLLTKKYGNISHQSLCLFGLF
jgi:hypothetical protein